MVRNRLDEKSAQAQWLVKRKPILAATGCTMPIFRNMPWPWISMSDSVHVQEYAPPGTIEDKCARERFAEVKQAVKEFARKFEVDSL